MRRRRNPVTAESTLLHVELNRFAWTASFGVVFVSGGLCGLFVRALGVVGAGQVVLNLQVVRAVWLC